MVRQELGLTIDIHLGGGDLVFPHHENEIAQSETANGTTLAKLWMHNGMVNVGGTKMSKSLGNFTTIRALLDSGVSPMTRCACLCCRPTTASHSTSPPKPSTRRRQDGRD